MFSYHKKTPPQKYEKFSRGSFPSDIEYFPALNSFQFFKHLNIGVLVA